jgi:hypothetical protein
MSRAGGRLGRSRADDTFTSIIPQAWIELWYNGHKDLNHSMSQTVVLSDHVYRKLTRSAAARGLTVEAWLKLVTDAADGPRAKVRDRHRGRSIEQLLAKCRDRTLTDHERVELDRLVDEEYQVAIERADARIAAKQTNGSRATKLPVNRTTASRRTARSRI